MEGQGDDRIEAQHGDGVRRCREPAVSQRKYLHAVRGRPRELGRGAARALNRRRPVRRGHDSDRGGRSATDFLRGCRLTARVVRPKRAWFGGVGLRAIRPVGVLVLMAAAWPALSRAELPEAFGAVDAKVVLVDFWASWCAPCRRSLPWMNEMHRKYASEGLESIGVNVDKERGLADEFLGEKRAESRVHLHPTGGLD